MEEQSIRLGEFDFKLDPSIPLIEDLADHLYDSSVPGWKMIHHPLVIEMPYNDGLNSYYNARYEAKKKAVDDALREHKWAGAIFLHERPYRFDILQHLIVMGTISDPAEIWTLVVEFWIDCENVHENFEGWRELWSIANDLYDVGTCLEHAMNEKEVAAYNALPDEVTIYRGVRHPDAIEGISWTVDRAKALWFAHRFASDDKPIAYLATGKVNKKDIRAHILARGESEIIVMPEDVRDIKVSKPKKRKKA